jgi:hypothetical protein
MGTVSGVIAVHLYNIGRMGVYTVLSKALGSCWYCRQGFECIVSTAVAKRHMYMFFVVEDDPLPLPPVKQLLLAVH